MRQTMSYNPETVDPNQLDREQLIKVVDELQYLVELSAAKLTEIETYGVLKLGLTKQQIMILQRLMRGIPLGSDTLGEFLSRNELADPVSQLKVQIHKMRPKLASIGVTIETVWGFGYRMDRKNIDTLRSWLRDVA